MRIRKNKKVIRLTESDLRRITKKVLNEQGGLLGWLIKKSAGKIGSEAAEAIVKRLPSSWKNYHELFLNNIITKDFDELSKWVSPRSGISMGDVMNLINRQLDDIAAEPTEATFKKISSEMNKIPSVVQKTQPNGQIIIHDFREPYKEYLEQIVKSGGKSLDSKVTNFTSFMKLIKSGGGDVFENIGKIWKSTGSSNISMSKVSKYILDLENAIKKGKITAKDIEEYLIGIPREITNGETTIKLRNELRDLFTKYFHYF